MRLRRSLHLNNSRFIKYSSSSVFNVLLLEVYINFQLYNFNLVINILRLNRSKMNRFKIVQILTVRIVLSKEGY